MGTPVPTTASKEKEKDEEKTALPRRPVWIVFAKSGLEIYRGEGPEPTRGGWFEAGARELEQISYPGIKLWETAKQRWSIILNGNVRKISFYSENPRVLRNTVNRRVAQILAERQASKGKEGGPPGSSGSHKDDDGGFGWLPGTMWVWDDQLLVRFNKGKHLEP